MHPAGPQHVAAPKQAGPPLQPHTPLALQVFWFGHEHPPDTHCPDEHCWLLPHATSHAPQCAGSLEVSKQPAREVIVCEQQRWLPTQASPPSHEQPPFTHCSPIRQLLPHAPQLATSPERSVQTPPQQVWSLVQEVGCGGRGPPGPNPPGAATHAQVPCRQISPA